MKIAKERVEERKKALKEKQKIHHQKIKEEQKKHKKSLHISEDEDAKEPEANDEQSKAKAKTKAKKAHIDEIMKDEDAKPSNSTEDPPEKPHTEPKKDEDKQALLIEKQK